MFTWGSCDLHASVPGDTSESKSIQKPCLFSFFCNGNATDLANNISELAVFTMNNMGT